MREVLVPQWFLLLGNLLGTSQELAMSDDGGPTVRHASAKYACDSGITSAQIRVDPQNGPQCATQVSWQACAGAVPDTLRDRTQRPL
jgi:hypothetical protein